MSQCTRTSSVQSESDNQAGGNDHANGNDLVQLRSKEELHKLPHEGPNNSPKLVAKTMFTILEMVAGSKEEQCALRDLRAAGFTIQESTFLPNRALFWAIQARNELALRWLLREAHSNINVITDHNRTLLHVAVEVGDEAITRLLLANAANINSRDDRGDSVT